MYNRILSKAISKSSKSVLLLGPRQTGKSTLIKSLKPELIINLADEQEYFTFQTNLDELSSRINAKKPKTVFIDEIQRIPRLTNSLQVIIDSEPKIKFYLSGSSARKLRKGKANLLPGRLFTFQLAPLCIAELGNDWNDLMMMQFGSLPGVVSLPKESEKKKLLQSYANTYLKEEILAESLVRGVDGFIRFLREAAVNSGGFLDFSKLAKKAKIPRQSVVRHFEILEDTLIAKKIGNDPDLDVESYDLVKHPKYFFFDIGVVNALRGSFEISADRIGSAWEHIIYNQITNSSQAFDHEINIYNFRTRGGLEVDFIVKRENQIFILECKSSTSVDSSDYKNLLAIDRYYPKSKKILIYRGKHDKKQDGVWMLPLPKALEVMGLK
ncbi:MAG: ATP-binding protein [Pseudobdellovibrionaceae bacterium]